MNEIRQVETLSEADRATLFDWGTDIFGADRFKLRWRPKDLHFLMVADGEVVSHVGILKHEVSVANRSIKVGGVGGVVTVPAAQKRGYASDLMRHAANFFSGWGIQAGLLFCMPYRIKLYESLGWQLLSDAVFLEQPEGVIESPLKVMVLPLHTQWPKGAVALNSFPW